MSEDHIERVAPLESRLLLAKMEIDDDDQDIVLVSIEISNEASIPMGGLDIFIQTSGKTKVESNEGISSIGPGLTRTFTFEFPLDSGNWTFMIRSNNVELDLGPYDADFTFEASKSRVVKNSIGAGMFSNVFNSDLDAFGNTEERGIIDSSEIEMTPYFGENAIGGSTEISVGSAPEVVVDDDDLRTPPWQKDSDLLTSLVPTSTSMEPEPIDESQIIEEEAENTTSSDLLSFSKALGTQEHTETDASEQELVVEINETPLVTAPSPPPLPINKESVEVDSEILEESPATPSSPPNGPPSSPPSAKPSSPPSGPPSAKPSSPPSGPPSAKPSSPPSGPPSGPPNGPPSAKPSSPPSGPPSSKPSKPPKGPPKSNKPPKPPM